MLKERIERFRFRQHWPQNIGQAFTRFIFLAGSQDFRGGTVSKAIHDEERDHLLLAASFARKECPYRMCVVAANEESAER
jgi:hypothetical protein